jgi:hypothetical protein
MMEKLMSNKWAYFELLHRHMPEKTEKNQEKLP